MRHLPTERVWQVRPRRWRELAETQRTHYGAIVASYGGKVAQLWNAHFRLYRVAEACAQSVRSQIGVEAEVELALLTDTL